MSTEQSHHQSAREEGQGPQATVSTRLIIRVMLSPSQTWADENFCSETFAKAVFTLRPAVAPFATPHPGQGTPHLAPPSGRRAAFLHCGPQCWFRSQPSEEEPLGADHWVVP